MTFTNHFSTVDGAIGPQPWVQLRCVKTARTISVSKTYDPNDGRNKFDLLQSVTASWTNNSPINQLVYGLVSKSGSQVTLQCRSRGYLRTRHGVGINNFSPPMYDTSYFGIGTDLGNGGLLALGGAYGISEIRQNSTTIPLLPGATGWFTVQPGQTITGSADVTFISEFWENTQIAGGEANTESRVITGDLGIDLFSVGEIIAPANRYIPTLVGGTSNVKSAISTGATTTVVSPSSLATNDTLVAVVASESSEAYDIAPVQSGWRLMHSRDEGFARVFYIGLESAGVSLRVYARTVIDPAANYSFTNTAGSEQTVVLFGLRNALTLDSAEGADWYAASNLSRWQVFNEMVAPSINRQGQLLLSLSYVPHVSAFAPVAQTAPEGMTSLGSFAGTRSTLAVAMLGSPPKPTKARRFVPDKAVFYTGTAVAASILIPGRPLT